MSALDPNATLSDDEKRAIWNAIDAAHHMAAGFDDSLQNPPDERTHWPIASILHEADSNALAIAFAAWMNACAAVYQPPKAGDAP